MKKLRILLAMLIALAMLASCSTPAAPAEDGGDAPATEDGGDAADDGMSNVNMTGMPIVNETIELDALVSLFYLMDEWNGHPAFVHLEELTNVKVNFESVPDEGFIEKRNLIFASNELPDFIIRAKLTPEEETKYATAQQIIPLDPYFADYAPNFSAMLAEDSNLIKSIAAADGSVYSMPQINTTLGNLMQKHWINSTWLDNLGLAVPTTTDELYEALVAFRDQDANGNGDTTDEIPFGAQLGTVAPTFNAAATFARTFYGSFGMALNYGAIDFYSEIDDEGMVKLLPLQDGYEDMLTYLNMLWEENLIHKEIFAQDLTQLASQVNSDTVGYATHGNNTQWMGATREQFVAVPALEGPDGSKGWNHAFPKVQTTGTFAITSANEHPEATMRWVDHLYSEEGTVLVRFGIEGESYEVVDGEYELLDHILNDPNGLTLDEAIAQWGFFVGGNIPQNIFDKVDASAAQLPETKAADAVLEPDMVPLENIPVLHYTDEETMALGQYSQDIKNFINENTIKFITGERPIEEYADFVAELEAMNVDEYTGILQAAFDRWMAG